MGSAKKKYRSYSAGERGRNRVRAFEDHRTGVFYLESYVWDPERAEVRPKRTSLGHRDWDRAKQQADEAAARLACGRAEEPGAASLYTLFDIYLREVTPEKSKREQGHDAACAEMLLRFFGGGQKAKTLSRRDWDAFIRERRMGRIRPAGKKKPTEVGNRTVERDLRWLYAVFRWATMAGDGRSGYLLQRNPLEGYPFPREESPRRPMVTEERYRAMRAVAASVNWRFEVALVLAHETGHRIRAIRHLRWSDIDLERGLMCWRRGSDKIGFEHTTPLTEEGLEALENARKNSPAIGDGWLLAAPREPSKPVSRDAVRRWWLRAEKKAGLEHVPGLGWHGLRRKFATELKDTPLKDLSTLGGWKSTETLLRCYQRPDEETMRAALERRRTLRAGARG